MLRCKRRSNLSALAVFAGAIGAGIGFGLQNITRNFISGLVVLAERPIKIGDRVEVGNVTGQIKSIRARSTTILTNDNIAIIVPNSDFIEKPVINWSHGDPRVRFRIRVGISIDSDLAKAREILIQVARRIRRRSRIRSRGSFSTNLAIPHSNSSWSSGALR